MLLRDALTRTGMWTCTAVAPVKACHVAVNRNRGGSVAIIAEKPLRARGGFFRLSQRLTNGQPCFLARSHPGFICSSSLEKKIRVLNILDSFYKAKTWFYSFNGMCVSVNIFMCVSVRLFPPVLQSKLPPLFFIFQ